MCINFSVFLIPNTREMEKTHKLCGFSYFFDHHILFCLLFPVPSPKFSTTHVYLWSLLLRRFSLSFLFFNLHTSSICPNGLLVSSPPSFIILCFAHRWSLLYECWSLIGYYGGPTPYTIAPHSAVWLPDVDVVVISTVFLQLIRAIPPPDDLNNQRIGALLCRRVGCKSTGGVAPKKQIAISNLLQVYYDSDSSDDFSSLE